MKVSDREKELERELENKSKAWEVSIRNFSEALAAMQERAEQRIKELEEKQTMSSVNGKPVFSKKQYEFIAQIIKNQYELLERYGAGTKCRAIEEFAKILAYEFEQDNPRFERETFLNACGGLN